MERFAPSGPGGVNDGLQDPADFGRYREALRRSRLLLVAIIAPLTLLVLAVSLWLPPTYLATATIALHDEGLSRAGGNPELVRRELETVERLVTTKTVLGAAARGLSGESADTLSEKVSASASEEANLIRVSAEDDSAAASARIANVVVSTFLADRVAAERRAVAASRRDLRQRIERLARSGRQDELAALRERLTALAGAEAELGADLALADRARAPDGRDAPRVLENTLFAFFGFTFLAILIALAREQIAPRVRDARQLESLLGAPLLVEMPAPRSRSLARDRRAGDEAYDVLQEAVRAQHDGGEAQTLVVASPSRELDAARVALGLARAVAANGERVALIGGAADSGRSVPVGELLRNETSASSDDALGRAESHSGLLVFSADDDARLGTRDRLRAVVEKLAEHDVGFVVVVGRSLLVSHDALLLPRLADGLVLVCRPNRMTRDDARRVFDLVRAADANVLGIVSLGGRQIIPYAARRPGKAPRAQLRVRRARQEASETTQSKQVRASARSRPK